MKKIFLTAILVALTHLDVSGQNLERSFRNPPDTVKPWVIWFWINGNISHEGITKDLESMKQVGIGGVVWMEVSGPNWAPQGPIEAGSIEWHEAIQWAIAEADRLGLSFALSIDFGYGSGGPHITPDLSMKKLVWSITKVQGGKPVVVQLKKPPVDIVPKNVWLRPGQTINPVVTKALKEVDSYRDVAIFALPSSQLKGARLFQSNTNEFARKHLQNVPGIPGIESDPLKAYDGRGWKTHLPSLTEQGEIMPLAVDMFIDLSDRTDDKGKLRWDAPKGDWTIIRLGHATNVKMTRPSPNSAVGLECDRLNARGIDAHFEHRLKPILDAAGDKAGRTLQYVHLDSWEALGQNWSAGFAEEFKKRRGYDISPWLPVFTGHVMQSIETTERFLWDLRLTVGEVTLANYINRLRSLAAPYGIRFSCEPYGRLCVNSLDYASRSDFPIAEFWTERQIEKPFPTFQEYWYTSMKGLASVANTYGKARVGAEAFTGSRGWVDHPYLIKGMGDEAFSEGISHYVIHLSAHQAYDHMKPGLTHRKWGQHFNRHQTWWDFSSAWFEYVARCQSLLQQGRRVVDVACLYHEGAPLNFNNIQFTLPAGYDYDFCTPEIIQQMEVRDNRIYIPSGVSYRYLVLPRSGRLTLRTARKIEELQKAGASIYLQSRIIGTPGLEGYPNADRELQRIAEKWTMLPKGGWKERFDSDKVKPDFEGKDLKWIHRRIENMDLYFVANTKPKSMERKCTFRIQGKIAELWNPETGEIFTLPVKQQRDARTSTTLYFEPSQSWFVVFRDKPSALRSKHVPLATWKPAGKIEGKWNLSFDPDWGSKDTLTFDTLQSWSEHSDSLVKYYSGSATYRKDFDVTGIDIPGENIQYSLDLGKVEVMARVKLNGKDCGIAWKPPFRIDINHAIRPGSNKLEIAVVNTWINRMIGDEQLPLDAKWKDWETLIEWPEWFKNGRQSPAGRYTFTTVRHYQKESTLMPAGLLGPVQILMRSGTSNKPNTH
jgi:hypothetical protein